MTDGRDPTRRSVLQLVEDLRQGRLDDAESRCAPAARWWLPLDGADELAAAAACTRLAALLTSAVEVDVAALIVAPEGGRAVVELNATPRGVPQPTTVTMVLQVDGGLVVGGKAYLDVAAWTRNLA